MMSFVSQQFFFFAPMLLVSVIGVVLAIIFMGRHTTTATLVLIGCVLNIAAIFAVPLLQANLISQGTHQSRTLITVIGVAGSALRSAGFGLLLVAAFVGRQRQ